MPDMYTYRLWCDTEGSWKWVRQSSSLSEPATCPTNPGDSIDATKTAITNIDPIDKALLDENGAIITDGESVVEDG